MENTKKKKEQQILNKRTILKPQKSSMNFKKVKTIVIFVIQKKF